MRGRCAAFPLIGWEDLNSARFLGQMLCLLDHAAAAA
jgi:hypothetical protein